MFEKITSHVPNSFFLLRKEGLYINNICNAGSIKTLMWKALGLYQVYKV